ncbi:hypothetical protein [Metasolibacillus sp. FSL K6-0083]|uniref:hypothetical protein n=1 Tax=Metasolibacillus sp. FSL K6-0083 TaxID=2921416 RepID=UPI000791F154|nr:hypothetical protein A0U40_02845 [[Bacillus] sp. KCTC 13219]
MTDREFLEAILKKVESIDSKIDTVTHLVVKNSEDLTSLRAMAGILVTQTAQNSELQPSFDNAIAELETDMKIVKDLYHHNI